MIQNTDVLPEISDKMSPMMLQYLEIKKQYKDCLLFFRLGDFYEMFYHDAEVASDELDLVLTGRASGDNNKAPMCGVPYHSCEAYIARLVKKGYRVAICEQTEDPKKAKKLVSRDVVRVITPGTVMEETMLDTSKNNYLCTVFQREKKIGVCFVDISTGEMHATQLESGHLENDVMSELVRFCPKEVLFNAPIGEMKLVEDLLSNRLQSRAELKDNDFFCDDEVKAQALQHFKVDSFEAVGLVSGSEVAFAVSGAIQFLYETQKHSIDSVTEIHYYSDNQYMRLDLSARTNLELCRTMRSQDKRGSLLGVLDHTKTPMGKRLIQNWIEMPLLNCAQILKRQNAVEELLINQQARDELQDALKQIKDLERIMGRIVYGSANAKDLTDLADTLERVPNIKQILSPMRTEYLKEINENTDALEEISALIRGALKDKLPQTVREGDIIRDGFNAEVDSLRNDRDNSQEIIKEVELREQEKTGVKKLRIKYNHVFGYYIEIPASAGDIELPEEYTRRQTLANCERYTTDELKVLESRILGAQDKLVSLEYDLFCELRQRVAMEMNRVKLTASSVAQLDVLWSFALTAAKYNYVCPEIALDGKLSIIEGRHPVVEQLSNTAFVPNDTVMDNADNRCSIITGPNMAGKSTYMRQTAIIVLMSQIGSFVPAKSARVGIVDAIFTRVGASDDLASGQSTFMVEMNEVANILKNATSRSLLILDEIGRGTSTYDGMAIARAVLEYVSDKRKIGAKCLFATHYHELTVLEGAIDGVKNYSIAAKKRGDDIIFLRRIVRGGADESYGIEVAKLAGIPNGVVKRAHEILESLEAGTLPKTMPAVVKEESDQISFSSTATDELVRSLQNLDVNTLTPIEAMQTLYDLSAKAKKI